jgi:Mrp family chromosome partitioning ATPase
MSNIGKAIDRFTGRPADGSYSNSNLPGQNLQKHYIYEDQIVSKRDESERQIRNMRQPRLFSQKELARLRFVHADFYDDEQRRPFEDLRNKIAVNHATKGGTVVVTSVVSDYSASVFCRNLAATIAQDESCTSLLIECKKEKDRLYLTEKSSTYGVTDFVEDEGLLVSDAIYPTGIARMRVVPFGNSYNPGTDFLRSTRMRVLVKDVSHRYRERYTIIDAPSVSKASDVDLLNEYADQIILTVPYGMATEREVSRAIKRFDKDKFLGVVFNNVIPLPDLISRLF